MWIDNDGVLHTVALPNSADLMSPEFRRGLDSLALSERERLRGVVEDAQDRLLEADWSHLAAGSYDSATPPTELLQGAVTSSSGISRAIEGVPERWRLDVALALEDYIDGLRP